MIAMTLFKTSGAKQPQVISIFVLLQSMQYGRGTVYHIHILAAVQCFISKHYLVCIKIYHTLCSANVLRPEMINVHLHQGKYLNHGVTQHFINPFRLILVQIKMNTTTNPSL